MEELKEIYFAFYDQLNEPERSEAKANWDYENHCQHFDEHDFEDCICQGFRWHLTPQKGMYWAKIQDLIATGEYPTKNKTNMVENPSHYGGKDNPYEVIKVLEAWGLNKRAYLWNSVKYIARAGKKDVKKEIEDLKKSIFYIQKEIELLEKL